MSIKKYTNGSWTPACRKYGTETDSITTLPVTIIGDGTPITSYTVKGNMEQNGTPTPSSPIYPSECGERTENLFDKLTWDNVTATRGTVDVVANGIRLTATANDAYTQTYGNAEYSYPVTAGETYTLSWDIDNPNVYGIVYLFSGSTTSDTVLSNVVASAKKATFTIPNGHQYLSFRLGVSSSGDTLTYTNLMLNSGSTALPYEPYGYKLPLTLGSTTTNIYLGEVQSTRRVKKLVLTGGEDWSKNDTAISGATIFTRTINDGLTGYTPYCTHYAGSNSTTWASIPTNSVTISIVSDGVQRLAINVGVAYSEIIDFKTYLQQQYAAGTPVTVWYVLAEPTTGIVNEPLRKIGDYVDSVSGTGLATSGTAQELNIETTLKPSEVDMTYHGWHEHEDTKYST